MPETPTAQSETPIDLLLSVVVPVLNEEHNVGPLVDEIRAALATVCAFEILFVDDGSVDGTPARLTEARSRVPELRVIRHGRRAGQSAALRSGVSAARGHLIATLDGDGQNDPADIPTLLETWRAADRQGRPAIMVTGHRVNRRDSWARRRAARLANVVRRALLGDDNPDTGCSLKLYQRALFLRMPYFDHMHRYLPALAQREGAVVEVVPVNHRARRQGASKYTNLGRLIVAVPDLLGVIWLLRRAPRGLEIGEVD